MQTAERELTPLEVGVQALIEKHGYIKVNLVHEDGSNEGIWATPVDEQSATRARDDNSSGEEITVRLCNQPLGWGEKSWGDVVKAITQGEYRPKAHLHHQV